MSGSERLLRVLSGVLNRPDALLLGVLLLGCLLVLVVPGSRGGKLATGRRGGWWECWGARRRCLRQMRAARRQQVALTINDPADAGWVGLPDLQPGVLVMGMPGCGKTFGTINPLLRSAIRQDHGVILFDWKYPEQAAVLVPEALRWGYEVDVLAPGYAESQIFNPLDLMEDELDLVTAAEIAQTLARNFNVQEKGGDPFFLQAGAQLLEGAMAISKGSDFPDLLTVQALLSLPNLAARLYHAELSPVVRAAVGQFMAAAGSAKTAAGIVSAALGPLNQFIKGDLAGSFCGHSSFDLQVGRGRMVVLGMDRVRSQVCAPLLAVALHLITQRNLARERRVPLVLGLDEMATLRIPIEDWLNRYRSAGLCALMGVQNLGQLQQVYGQELARAIVAGAPTKFIYNPGELESAKVFSEFLGEQDVEFMSGSRGWSGGRRSHNESQQRQRKPVFEVQQLLKLRRGHCVVVSPGYCSRGQAFVPMRHHIRVSEAEKRAGVWSQQTWQQFTQGKLVRAAPGRSADLGLRQKMVAQMLPLPQKQGAT